MSDVFQLDQPLPPDRTTLVLEASAGTGKTFTIAAMIARYIAQGLTLNQILAVTFSRRATNELTEGIRSRLMSSRDTLRRYRDDGIVPADEDPLAQLLCDGNQAAVESRLAKFDHAIGQVDDAPIFTLHTFASRMLRELGISADYDPQSNLEADQAVLINEVISDVYLSDSCWDQIGWESAKTIGREATEHFSEELYAPGDHSDLRVRFAEEVRDTLNFRKRIRQQISYNDMLTRLAATLTDPESGPLASRMLSSRFPVVLVDEFQDTDPMQWQFLDAGFSHKSTLLLIGDPKQAIYRFRGGDIETYHKARSQADAIQHLATNYRSDAAVTEGIADLFNAADLGSPGVPIEFTPVASYHHQARLHYDDACVPSEAVRIRAIDANAPLAIGKARSLIADDLIGQVEKLLDGSYHLQDRTGDERPLTADDIVILVNTTKTGSFIHHKLQQAGYTTVFSGEKNVFASPAAGEWLVFLEGLETPDRWHQRRAMLTRLAGWTSADIASADDTALVEMASLLSHCGRRLNEQGIAAVFETLVAERDLYPRLLSSYGGEELLSDFRQITELLNTTQNRGHLGASALTEYLRRSINQSGSAAEDERVRRLPTDRAAIRIMTVHKAKGLQFPVVLLPEASDRWSPKKPTSSPLVGHVGHRRVLDLDPPECRESRVNDYQAEHLAESLRSFYVACTRAQSLLICWWAPTKANTASAPLHRLLSMTTTAQSPASRFPVGSASQLRRGRYAITMVDPDLIARTHQAERTAYSAATKLGVRTLSTCIDHEWIRTSYSGLTYGLHDSGIGPVASEAGFDESPSSAEQVSDAPSLAVSVPEAEPVVQADQPVSAMQDLPAGIQFGSLVHAVLEEVDPASDQLAADLTASITGLLERYPLTGLDAGALAIALEQVVTTPLSWLTDGLTLRDLGAKSRLAEFDFELPLGDSGDSRSTVADLARLFTTMLDESDPLHSYGKVLAESSAGTTVLAGFLTGSIDLILQLPGEPSRFALFDYKTNRLADFRPQTMASAMIEAHYPLQALLYGAALHRYLDWRLPCYRPDINLGGVGYLFVRGMCGAENPDLGSMPSGVFTWQPPAAMIVAASQILAGGSYEH